MTNILPFFTFFKALTGGQDEQSCRRLEACVKLDAVGHLLQAVAPTGPNLT
jgi:hypothetical protein